MKLEEHETNINYDYSDRVVRIYTTREGVVNQILKRANNAPEITVEQVCGAWSLVIPMQMVRAAHTVVKVAKNGTETGQVDESEDFDLIDEAVDAA